MDLSEDPSSASEDPENKRLLFPAVFAAAPMYKALPIEYNYPKVQRIRFKGEPRKQASPQKSVKQTGPTVTVLRDTGIKPTTMLKGDGPVTWSKVSYDFRGPSMPFLDDAPHTPNRPRHLRSPSPLTPTNPFDDMDQNSKDSIAPSMESIATLSNTPSCSLENAQTVEHRRPQKRPRADSNLGIRAGHREGGQGDSRTIESKKPRKYGKSSDF